MKIIIYNVIIFIDPQFYPKPIERIQHNIQYNYTIKTKVKEIYK